RPSRARAVSSPSSSRWERPTSRKRGSSPGCAPRRGNATCSSCASTERARRRAPPSSPPARQRCYVNCFEPAGDLLRLVLEGMFRESAAGPVVLKHTVPGEASSMLIVTHDIDAPDADNEGPWGPPGALQVAALELARGVRATFNVTTDYVSGYYNEATMRQLCALGLC